MKKTFLFIFLIAVVFARSQSVQRIQVRGNKFENEKRETMIFRGLNTSDPDKLTNDGHWNKEYFTEMKNWGANIVRFPVHPEAWRKRGQTEYLKILDSGIVWAKEFEIYVIIDWHSIGNLRSEMFQSANYETTKKETFEFWRTMARKYKDEPTVAFFELFNEPTVYNGQLGTCTWAQWKELNEEMITIIRAHGCKTIPLVAGFNWAYDLTEAAANPINKEGIGYVSHPYPMKISKPWETQWTKDWGMMASKYPLILTEIGFCGTNDIGAHIPVMSDESYGDAITKYTAEKGISYVVWVFDQQWAPRLFNDWKFTPSRQGRYFKKALQATLHNQATVGIDSKLYELRIYYCEPNRLDALLERFANHTTKLFEKHGMTNVGYWVPISNEKNALYYVLSFPNIEAKEKAWKDFVADPEWKKVQSKSEESGKIISKIESYLLNTTDYSPLIQTGVTNKSRVFELRTYFPNPGQLNNLNNRFKNYTLRGFEKYGMTNIGYWNTVEAADTTQPRLIYMLAHDSEEAAKISFDNFRKDTEKIAVFEASERNGKLVEKIESVFLKPLPFSKIK